MPSRGQKASEKGFGRWAIAASSRRKASFQHAIRVVGVGSDGAVKPSMQASAKFKPDFRGFGNLHQNRIVSLVVDGG
jgi:hypothetical protein